MFSSNKTRTERKISLKKRRYHGTGPADMETLRWLDETAHAKEEVLKRLHTQEHCRGSDSNSYHFLLAKRFQKKNIFFGRGGCPIGGGF